MISGTRRPAGCRGEATKEPLSDDERASYLGSPEQVPGDHRSRCHPATGVPLCDKAVRTVLLGEPTPEPRGRGGGRRLAGGPPRRLLDERAECHRKLAVVRDLVLRGSVLLKKWLGAAPREPGDLDFVVIPRELEASVPPDAADARLHRRRRTASVRLWTCHHRRLRFDIEECEPTTGCPGCAWCRPDRRPALRRSATRLRVQRAPASGPELTEVSLSSAGPRPWSTPRPPSCPCLEGPVADHGHVSAGEGPLRRGASRRADALALRPAPRACDDWRPAIGRLWVTLATMSGLDCVHFRAFHADHPDLSADGHDLVQRLAVALEPTFDEHRPRYERAVPR